MATSVAKRTPLGPQPRCRTVASCGDSEKCLQLTACGDADRVRHRSIYRAGPALPQREAHRSGAGECRRSACSPLSLNLARGRVRQGANILRNGSSAITKRSSGLAIKPGGVDNRLAASRSTLAFGNRMPEPEPCLARRRELGSPPLIEPTVSSSHFGNERPGRPFR